MGRRKSWSSLPCPSRKERQGDPRTGAWRTQAESQVSEMALAPLPRGTSEACIRAVTGVEGRCTWVVEITQSPTTPRQTEPV